MKVLLLNNKTFKDLSQLDTEAQNQNSIDIDTANSLDIVRIINSEDKKCADAVLKAQKDIAKAIDFVVDTINVNGNVFYIGAGTSGRLAVLDASECPPTFGTDPRLFQGVIAGGYDALVSAQEGSEDREDTAWNDLLSRGFSDKDILIGIMASGRTPYVISAIDKAIVNKNKTIIISCNKAEFLKVKADINICVHAGPEVIAGSTRMKSGTMQKMILNMISTGAMVRLGKVYKNTMVDLQMNSEKLIERSKKLIMDICSVNYDIACHLLNNANGHVKSAIVMHFKKLDLRSATKLLEKHKGFLRPILEE
jgi:N-acetylmuramic acid 6-phosphate etherase